MSENHESKDLILPTGVAPSEDEESDGVAVPDQGRGEGEIHHVESKEDMFVDAPDDMQENQFQEMENNATLQDCDSSSIDEIKALLEKTVQEKNTIANQLKEERESVAKKVAVLRLELKGLSGDDGNQEEMVVDDALLLHEMLSKCSQSVKVALDERLQAESKIKELNQRIEDLNVKVQEEETVEVVMDRMLSSLTVVVNPGELLDYSFTGKVAHVEKCVSLLVEHYNWMLYEIDQLRQCLLEGGFNFGGQEEFGLASVFSAARGELVELKRKEVEMVETLSCLEQENRKLAEQVEAEKNMAEAANAELGMVKLELEQEKNRFANTKEKLSMAVTKGKALVQQRDSLKQSLAEKTSELEKSLAELQEKSSAIKAAEMCKGELLKCENLVASLQETHTQRNTILESLEEIFSRTNIPEGLQSMDVIAKLKWLVNEVASLQEMLSKKDALFQNLEEILSHADVPKELSSTDLIERLRWLLNLVSSFQEILSQRNKLIDKLEESFSQINLPAEIHSLDIVERLKWLAEERNALRDNLLEFHKLKDALSLIDLPETASSSDLKNRIGWLKESVNQAKFEINELRVQLDSTKTFAQNEIDRLSALLSTELQESEYIKMELDVLARHYEEAHQDSSEKHQMVQLIEHSGITADNLEAYQKYSDPSVLIDKCFWKIKEQSSSSDTSAVAEVFERIQGLLYVRDQELMICEKLLEEDMLLRSEVSNLSSVLKLSSVELSRLEEEKETLLKDLARSEEKSALLREKLSLAVKKGKGVVQDRENLKHLVEEKNSEIQNLKLELQKQESIVTNYRDEINRLSADLELIAKLEADLVAMKGQRDELEQFLLESNNMLQRVIESIDSIVLPVDSAFEEPVQKVIRLAGYLNECQQAKIHLELELEKVKDESNILTSELAEAQRAMKSLEDALSVAENHISKLSEEKGEMEVAKRTIELDLKKATDETTAQTNRFTEACTVIKSFEESLSQAENNISEMTKEREKVQLSRVSMEAELEKVREDIVIQTSKHTEAFRTIKSLEDALSQAEANISLLIEQNNHAQDDRTNLENEIRKLQEEAESQTGKLAAALLTIKSLEDAFSKASNDISALEDEKRIAEEKISMLDSKLKTCMDELLGTNGSLESRSVELMHHLHDLQLVMKNESLLSMVRQHFEKQFESLKNTDLILMDLRVHFADTDPEALRSFSLMEEDSHMTKPFPYDLGNSVDTEIGNGELNAADVDNISMYFKNVIKGFQLRNKNLTDNFEGFSIFTYEFIEALSRKLRATKDAVIYICEYMGSLKEKMKNMELLREKHEKIIAKIEQDHDLLLSACTNATRELQFEVENNLLELTSVSEFEKLNRSLMDEGTQIGVDDMEHQQLVDEREYAKIADNLLLAARRAQTLAKLFERTSNEAAAKIEDMQTKLRDSRASSEKATKESNLMQNKVLELEADVERLQDSCKELRLKIADYQAIEERFNEREAQWSAVQEAEEPLMSASQLKILFEKISRIEIPFADSELGDSEPYSSVDVKKLFYIVDRTSELHNRINMLSHDKEELQSTLSTQILEIEHLKEENEAYFRNGEEYEKIKTEISELMFGFKKLIDILRGHGFAGEQKSSAEQGLLPELEKLIMALLLEVENSKSQAQELGSKLLGSQNVIDELSCKIKWLEDSLKSRTSQPEIVQERSIFEAPPLPMGSEISEIEDVGVGKNGISPVASAAHVRTLRKGSADHLALNVDLESGSLINEETDEDKGHMFKSLNTSGLIPKQGKSVADRIDGIWVSGGRVLMSRPRARLGIIAYWLFLHTWLLGTIL